MRDYDFVIHQGGDQREDLGGMSLAGDSEAIVFGNQVIRDMMHTDAQQYAGWVMDITEGNRVVGSILFGGLN